MLVSRGKGQDVAVDSHMENGETDALCAGGAQSDAPPAAAAAEPPRRRSGDESAWRECQDCLQSLGHSQIPKIYTTFLVFITLVLVCFFAGWITASASGVVSADLALANGSALGPRSQALPACDRRLKMVQAGFFLSHACWFDPAGLAHLAATDLLHRMEPHVRTGLVVVGTEMPGIDRSAGEAAWLEEWGTRLRKPMHATDGDNFGVVFAPPGDLKALQSAAEQWPPGAAKRVALHQLWRDGRGEDFDSVFQAVRGNHSADAKYIVTLQSGERNAAILSGMKESLRSNVVRALIWICQQDESKAKSSKARQSSTGTYPSAKTLRTEIDFVAKFGYAVYMASSISTSGRWNDQLKPGAFLRVDRAYWEEHYEEAVASGFALVLVAVPATDNFHTQLTRNHVLCLKHTYDASCHCEVERYQITPFSCSLGYLLSGAQGTRKTHGP
mmetsp:Transcript_12084/g.28657  ORF Transcript_12084/g.28657 Transcript_12084/m.28657 type:complete len:444 (-) Transcript_12084:263-1594(-)